ncbi:MAG TPA: PH domain-containing protein [Mycobacteriales bacterium]
MSLTVRPQRIRWYARIAAGVVVVVSLLAALLLRRFSTGVHFQSTDQVGVFGVGLFVAAGIMLVTRPRVEADEHGLRVRNLLGERTVPWDLVRAVEVRDGWPWASLDLVGDEVINLMAVQTLDGERTVVAMSALRDLHARGRTTA